MTSLGNWCFGLSQNIKAGKLKQTQLNNKTFVLSRYRNKDLRLFNDTCPHRGAALSEGKLKRGKIQCPYHGWEFNNYGNLVKVPSTDKYNLKCKLQEYPVYESGGFIWGDSLNSTLFCPQLDDSDWEKVYGEKYVSGNFVDWVMNGTDISHINFVHDFANENNAYVDNFQVIEHVKHIECFANVKPKASTRITESLQPENNNGSDIHSKFVFPGTSVIHIKLKEPFEFITFTTLTPVNDYVTKISWAFMYPKKGILQLPLFKARFHMSMYKTVSQDEKIIQSLNGIVPVNNVECDEFQLAVLNRLHQYIKL